MSCSVSSCVVTLTSVVCLEETRLDLYTAQLDSRGQFTLTMLPVSSTAVDVYAAFINSCFRNSVIFSTM